MEEILSYGLFNLAGQDLTVLQLLLTCAAVGAIIFLYRFVLKRYAPKLFSNTEISQNEKLKLKKILRGLAFLCLLLVVVLMFRLDYGFTTEQGFNVSVLKVIRLLLFLQMARLLYWLTTNVFIHSYYVKRGLEKQKASNLKPGLDSEVSAFKTIRNIFFLLVGIYALRNFNFDPTLYSRMMEGEQVSFRISNILQAILILMGARLIIWMVTQLLLYNIYTRRGIAVGSQYAINQLIKYLIYVFAIIMALGVFGINMNLLLGGAAALLVGIGLGLQQTFNDFICGLVLLFERSVSVGDVLEIDGVVGRVTEIGLRSSTLSTRGNISLVVPNHKLVNEKVYNWNHDDHTVRFGVKIGVAYGSDTTKVKKLLLEALKVNPYVVDYPAPFVRFTEFSDSTLDFKLYFFSKNLLVIEDVKSDIRLEIDRLFRENHISIPFPQREIHIRKDE